jgi:hypothetical protein
MRNRMFHQVRIGGMTFEGVIATDGPYLSTEAGGVALGVSGLRQFQPSTHTVRHTLPRGWWVVKYADEERIFLPKFSDASVQRLSQEFALPILADGLYEPLGYERRDWFLLSPAGDALCRWVTKHPRIAKTVSGCQSYLPGWYDWAVVQNGALSS